MKKYIIKIFNHPIISSLTVILIISLITFLLPGGWSQIIVLIINFLKWLIKNNKFPNGILMLIIATQIYLLILFIKNKTNNSNNNDEFWDEYSKIINYIYQKKGVPFNEIVKKFGRDYNKVSSILDHAEKIGQVQMYNAEKLKIYHLPETESEAWDKYTPF